MTENGRDGPRTSRGIPAENDRKWPRSDLGRSGSDRTALTDKKEKEKKTHKKTADGFRPADTMDSVFYMWSQQSSLMKPLSQFNSKSIRCFQTKSLILGFCFDLLHLWDKTCFEKATFLTQNFYKLLCSYVHFNEFLPSDHPFFKSHFNSLRWFLFLLF